MRRCSARNCATGHTPCSQRLGTTPHCCEQPGICVAAAVALLGSMSCDRVSYDRSEVTDASAHAA